MTTQMIPAPVTPGALAVPTTPDNRFTGFSNSDLVMPQAHIVQGLPKEKEKYGKCDTGDVINTLTLEKLFSYDVDNKKLVPDTANNTFIPICGWPEWVNWPKDAQRPIYRFRNRSDVPADDLVWKDAANGERIPPIAMQTFNFIVLFAADPSIPLALVFKKTSVKAGQTLLSLEKMRGRGGPGLYAMTFRKESKPKGTYIVPVLRPAGNPPPELKDIALEMAKNFSTANIEIADDDPLGGLDDAAAAEAANSGTV